MTTILQWIEEGFYPLFNGLPAVKTRDGRTAVIFTTKAPRRAGIVASGWTIVGAMLEPAGTGDPQLWREDGSYVNGGNHSYDLMPPLPVEVKVWANLSAPFMAFTESPQGAAGWIEAGHEVVECVGKRTPRHTSRQKIIGFAQVSPNGDIRCFSRTLEKIKKQVEEKVSGFTPGTMRDRYPDDEIVELVGYRAQPKATS